MMKSTVIRIIKAMAHNPAEVSPTVYKIGTAIYLMLFIMFFIFTFTVYSFSGQLSVIQENITNTCISVNTKIICDTFCGDGSCAVQCDGKNITLDQLPYQNFTLDYAG